MEKCRVDFDSLNWESQLPGVRQKTFRQGGTTFRVAEFTRDFVAPDWCRDGHVGSRLYRFVYKPKLVGYLAKTITPSLESEYLRTKPKLETTLSRGVVFWSRPAAFVMVVEEKRTPLNLESAQYATYSMDLFAQTRGSGRRNLVGDQSILNRSRELRQGLRLKKSERIFGLLGVGYPGVRFVNKVEGRSLPLQWNGTTRNDRGEPRTSGTAQQTGPRERYS